MIKQTWISLTKLILAVNIFTLHSCDVVSVPRCNLLSNEEKVLQQMSIEIFLKDIDQAFLDSCAVENSKKEMFSWRQGHSHFNVAIRNGAVTRISGNHVYHGDFAIHYLPFTVEKIHLTCCYQRYSIETRLLPRKLRAINMAKNGILGTLSLRDFPRGIEMINFNNNMIVGPLDLLDLPDDIEILSISHNYIEQTILYYGKMSPKVRSIDLQGNSIGKLVACDSKYTVKNKALFHK